MGHRSLAAAAARAAAAASALLLAGCGLPTGGDAAPPVERVEDTIGEAPSAEAPPEATPEDSSEDSPEDTSEATSATTSGPGSGGSDPGEDSPEGPGEDPPDEAGSTGVETDLDEEHSTVVLDLTGTSTVGSPGPVITSGWLETEIRAGLADEHRVQVQTVACPEDLPARAGSVLRCDLTMRDGVTLATDVVVEDVDGSQVSMPVHVLPADAEQTTAEEPTGEPVGGVPAALVQNFVVAEFQAETDRTSIAVCPGNLPAEQDAEMRCTLYAGSQHASVLVTVDAVTEETVDFSIIIE